MKIKAPFKIVNTLHYLIGAIELKINHYSPYTYTTVIHYDSSSVNFKSLCIHTSI